MQRISLVNTQLYKPEQSSVFPSQTAKVTIIHILTKVKLPYLRETMNGKFYHSIFLDESSHASVNYYH